jgi:dienelactone hydrolase
MVPAHHTGRNSHDLLVLGASFARAGGAAMAMESIGSGERGVAEPWAHKNCQGYLFGVQTFLAGDNPAGWTVFDISRGIDYLLARGDVDPGRIAIVGGVAGGGDITAAAAALDERIAVSIPFNFSATEPMEPWYDPLRSYWGAAAGGFTPWTIAALAAPRRLVQAQEFEWTDGEQQRLARFQKVYGWLGAGDHVAMLHGGPHTDATHFDRLHRMPLYAILNGWFDMRLPTRGQDEPAALPAANGLDCFQTPLGRKCLAEWRATGRLAEPHELAARAAKDRLAVASRGYRDDAARQAGRRTGGVGEKGAALGEALATRLGGLLGDTAPVPPTAATGGPRKLGTWRGAKVLGLWLPAETDGQLGLAAWLLMPPTAAGAGGRMPAVLGVCRAGKARMLAERGKDVERMLKAGIAVCLLDARGCGETSPGDSRLPDSNVGEMAFGLWGLRDSLIGRQLRDVRTTLAYLAARGDVDPSRMGLWGEGLAEPNGRAGEPVLFDEVPFRQTSPIPMHLSEPAGGMLAMMAALWPVPVANPADAGGGRVAAMGENASDVASSAAAPGGPATADAHAAGAAPRVRAVLVRGTLVSWMSVLQRRHHYVPPDAVVPGLLGVADMPLIAEALRAGGVALFVEDLRDGSNRGVAAEQVRREWSPAAAAGYAERCTDAGVDLLIRAVSSS